MSVEIGFDNMNETRTLSLLETLAKCAGCPYLSDLHYIKEGKRKKLTQKLETISPEAYPLGDWNDALAYLISAPPQQTRSAARKLLIDHFRNQEGNPLSQSSQGGNAYESE